MTANNNLKLWQLVEKTDTRYTKEAKNIDAACKILLENVRFESFAK